MRIQENLEKSKYEADGSLQIQGTINWFKSQGQISDSSC